MLYGLRPVEYLSWCHRRYGDVFRVELPFGTMSVFVDPNAIGEIFALRADDFEVGGAKDFVEPFVGARSLVLLDGERHRLERKTMVQSLHGEAMATYEQVMVDVTRREMATWPRGKPFTLHPRMQAITLDVILRLVFGADDPTRLSEFKSALQPWLDNGGSLMVLLPQFRHELGGRSPWGKFMAARRQVDELLDRHIRERRADPTLHERTDALSVMVQHLDDASVPDELITMLAAGHDTSATALAWAFDLLLHHPEALARLKADLDGDDDAYLDAVVKETLRLRPVIAEVGRRITHDETIGGVRLSAGASATGSILLAQRRPSVYPEPLAFRPDRFLGRPADPHSWLPFGGGIRRCIGVAFATLEIKTVLRTVLSELELRPASPKLERIRRRAVTLIPASGTRVVVQSRSRADSLVSISRGSTRS
jgi:cytochrome P450